MIIQSYAAVDGITGKYVRCEVELISITESSEIAFYNKECIMVDIPLEMVRQAIADVSEKDILIVEHDEGKVISVCGRDEAEMQRRIEEYSAIEES